MLMNLSSYRGRKIALPLYFSKLGAKFLSDRLWAPESILVWENEHGDLVEKCYACSILNDLLGSFIRWPILENGTDLAE